MDSSPTADDNSIPPPTAWPAPAVEPTIAQPELDEQPVPERVQDSRRTMPRLAGLARMRRADFVVLVTLLPGAWLLFSTLTVELRPGYPVASTPFVTRYLRSEVRSFGSVRLAQFYAEVLRPGQLLVGIGLLLALPAVWLSILRLVRRKGRPRKVVVAIFLVGVALIAVAPFVVRSRDSDVAQSFVQRTGTVRAQAAGACWFTGWSDGNFAEVRSHYSAVLPDGSALIACPFANLADWERREVGFPEADGARGQDLIGLMSIDEHGVHVVGTLQLTGEIVGMSVTTDNVAHIEYSADSGGGSVRNCDVALSPDSISDPC